MQDLADATRIADAAPEIGVVWNIVSAGDAPLATQVLAELHTCLANTGKHVQGEVQRAAEVPYVMRILTAAGGGWDPRRPFFSIVYCPVPPLQHEPDMLEAALALAREGVPMCVYSMGLAGATAPAGAVAQANAEILSAVVLFQLARPGLGCVYVTDTGVLDMRSGTYVAAAPEGIFMTQAMVGLARRYGLPVMASGFTGDSRGFSAASGSDAGTTALASVLMVPDLLVGAGMHAGAQLLSLPKIVLDCELFRFCLRVRDGLRVDEEDLMTAVIGRVGPGGHFLEASETRRNLRAGSMYRPRLLHREPADAPGEEPGGEVDRATDAVEEVLASYRPPALPAGAEEVIAGVLAEAGRALAAR